MLDYEKQRQLIVVFILAVILVIIGAIVALVFIWMPEEEEEKKYEVGVIESVSVAKDDILESYYKEISQMFVNEDLEAIYSLVGEDYLAYNELKREDFEKYLKEKEILGKRLELVTSSSYNVPGYSNVYYLDIKAVNEVYSIGIVIREISPENYTIAFDKFIDYSEDVYSATVNSVGLDIYERVRYTNSVEYKIKLANNYHKNIVINNDSLASAILLVSSDSSAKQPIVTTISTAQVKLKPEEFRGIQVVFKMDSESDYFMYNTLVVKDVLYDGMEGTTDIQYTMSN